MKTWRTAPLKVARWESLYMEHISVKSQYPLFPAVSLFIVFILVFGGCTSQSAMNLDDGLSPDTFSPSKFANACEAWDDWEKPAPPFRIHGGTFHVGTCGISAILITSSEGHLLIDSGTVRGGELVAANIEKLGISLNDVRYLTHTQEHGDHIGGMAYLKNRTEALMVTSTRAKSVFETGIINTDDPQYTPHEAMATVTVDMLVEDGGGLLLGDKRIVAHYTPGHSPGAISWRWNECQESECLTLVFTDGMGPFSEAGYRWTDHPEYLADYRASLSWLESVEVDICLAAHPSQMRLIKRIKTGALVDPDLCSRNSVFGQGRVDIIVQKEQGQ